MESYGERDCNYAPMPGDDHDGCCEDCGGPLGEQQDCSYCTGYIERADRLRAMYDADVWGEWATAIMRQLGEAE